ncbi:MAG: HNH endonuclease [Nitrospiraceae bacterium]|nr:MAG: HNH endonuclease [Nitrospiraceae bacterium]
MSKKKITERNIKLLWGRSGNKCAICQTAITEEGKSGDLFPVGVMAHIEGENPGIEGKSPSSARYNPKMRDNERADYTNLILLCPTCHTKIDNDIQEYTTVKLASIKKDHEKWVVDSRRTAMPEITFAELEVIVKYLVAVPISGSNITVIPPHEKIKRNNLSSEVGNLITTGMIQKKQVEKYLNENPDYQFSERLRAGFVNKYRELKDSGLEGDSLFYALFEFAYNNSPDFKLQSAGLSVLTHFFEICEVFEQ